MSDIPNFATAVPIQNDVIVSDATPDFSTAIPIKEPAPVSSEGRTSVISKAVQSFLNLSPAMQFKQSLEMTQKDLWPDIEPNESMFDYQKRAEEAFKPIQEAEAKQGIGKVLEAPMAAGIAAGAVKHPLSTAYYVGGFTFLDKVINLNDKLNSKFPNASPEMRDVFELGSMALNMAILGAPHIGVVKAKEFMKKKAAASNEASDVKIPTEDVVKLTENINLLPEEAADIKLTTGITDSQISASKGSGLPISVSPDKLLDLATKPYWEKLNEELGYVAEKPKDATSVMSYVNENGEKIYTKLTVDELKYFKDEVKNIPQKQDNLPLIHLDAVTNNLKKIGKEVSREDFISGRSQVSKVFLGKLVSDIKAIQKDKKLSGMTVSKLKQFIGIENIKKTEIPKLEKLKSFLEDLKQEDKFLSEKQVSSLESIIKDLPNPEVTPKRIVLEKFGEKSDILSGKAVSKVMPELVPSVDIKQGNPIITKIVNGVRDVMSHAEKEVIRRDVNFEKLISAAEKSRDKLLTGKEKLSRAIVPQNKEIFQALGGEKVELTPAETAVVAYLKNFFNMAKKDLDLEKSRKNYVTHIEKSLTEKILNKGLFAAIKESLSEQKPGDVPIDIMLELDNIIGSEKFFKYAMERKGGTDPTTNLRQILHSYSNLYETKIALDKILPEGQAVTHTLLKGKSAVWMKRFLQNLKGRGMDTNFRNGPMGWLSKVADAVVDVGYIKMLGFNWKSAIKNVVAGEANSWMYQDFPTYLKGKQRLISDPKKTYNLAKDYGILDGTYSDYAQKGIGGLKKLQELSMVGQKAGEVEVRGSIFASMLTDKEWETGKISSEKVNEIKDLVAITQGVFSKSDSPLILQTWYGRMFFQMNRWRITNAMMMRRVINDASADIKEGKYNTQNVTRLGKMIVAYGAGMYISNELYKGGYKLAGDVARNMANTIDGVATLFTEGDLVTMFTENPTLSTMKEISNTIMNTAAYLNFPGAKKAKGKGIEDTYIAPVKVAQDALSTIEQ